MTQLVTGRSTAVMLKGMALFRLVARGGAIAIMLMSSSLLAESGGAGSFPIPAEKFKLVESESGPVNYYRVVTEGQLSFVRAEYKPGYETAVLGFPLPEAKRPYARKLAWSWRALSLPHEGNECAPGKGDSAAVVYVSWKHGLRYYTLKYVWSSVGVQGAVCAKKRNPFVAQDTVILRSGGPLGQWQNEVIDLRAMFRKHFADGDPKAQVPDFVGVAIMSDGDQTKSASSADFGNFVLTIDPECSD